VLVIAAIPFAGPAPRAAAARTQVKPPTTSSSFEVPASNGYWVSVTATRTANRGPAEVAVSAVNERGKRGETSIEYSTHGRLAKDGGIDAKLPGLGRIAVSFEQTKVHRVKFVNPACGNPVTRLRKGVFTGTIAFHGEGGFTKVHRRSAQGQIRETFRHVCDEGEAVEPTGPIGTPNSQSLFVAGEGGGGTISFSAAGPPPLDPSLPPSGLATVLFWARYLGELRGMQVSAYVAATSGSNRFSVTTTAGAPTDAMVKPPAPFAGEAVFHLESPTTASWAGDLRVELPGVGAVALAGPGTWAALCEGIPCTETLPPGVR